MIVDVLQVPVPKDRLRCMPKDERTFFLMLGYIANQIIMLKKILIFSVNHEATDPIDEQLSRVQIEMLLSLMVGVLFEAWLLIERRFIRRPIGRDYQSALDEEGSSALSALKKKFGQSKLLAAMRNNFALHLPTDSDMERAFESAFGDQTFDDQWYLIFAGNKFNSSYMLCGLVFLHALFEALGEKDWAAGQIKIMKEVSEASDRILEFVHAFTSAMLKKHIGPEMLATLKSKITDVPNLQNVVLPFLVATRNDALLNTNTPRPGSGSVESQGPLWFWREGC